MVFRDLNQLLIDIINEKTIEKVTSKYSNRLALHHNSDPTSNAEDVGPQSKAAIFAALWRQNLAALKPTEEEPSPTIDGILSTGIATFTAAATTAIASNAGVLDEDIRAVFNDVCARAAGAAEISTATTSNAVIGADTLWRLAERVMPLPVNRVQGCIGKPRRYATRPRAYNENARGLLSGFLKACCCNVYCIIVCILHTIIYLT